MAPVTTERPERYDLVILGAGPAGYAAAVRAHDLGKQVLLIEKDRIGGRGIQEGALSSKTMWHLANDYAGARRNDRGFVAHDVNLSYASVMRAVNAAVCERRELLSRQLEGLGGVGCATGGRVWRESGTGRFVSPHEVNIERADGSALRVRGDHFLIATGSVPRRLPGIDVNGDLVVTSDHIESWPSFPESMVVVGAGVVGCEFATVFGHYGRTKLYLLDRRPRILPFEDEDVSQLITHSFEKMGVTIHREANLESLKVVNGKVEYVVTSPEGTRTVRVDRALISAGRVPNTANLGLDAAGVEVGRSGSITVNGTRTTARHIFAAGDTTADVALANVAELEGRHAVETMFGVAPHPIRYDALSAIMFLHPEVASVGLGEQQARERKVPYRVAVVHNQLVSRNVAMRSTGGFIKLLARPDSHRILGLRVVGPQASSCIQGIAFLIEKDATLEDIDYCVHPHPAVTEGVQECARLLLGRSLHKPSFLPSELLRVDEYLPD